MGNAYDNQRDDERWKRTDDIGPVDHDDLPAVSPRIGPGIWPACVHGASVSPARAAIEQTSAPVGRIAARGVAPSDARHAHARARVG